MTPAERLARRLAERNRHDTAMTQLPREDYPSCGCIWNGPTHITACSAHQR